MKQGHRLCGQRILGADGTAFELVAATAGKTEVFKGGLTALGLGMNVIYSHWLTSICLGRVTVSTAAIVCLKQAIVQIGGQVAH
jgi:hypothetical protein